MRGRTVTIESLDPSVPIELYADGERIGPLPATVEARRGAVICRCRPTARWRRASPAEL